MFWKELRTQVDSIDLARCLGAVTAVALIVWFSGPNSNGSTPLTMLLGWSTGAAIGMVLIAAKRTVFPTPGPLHGLVSFMRRHQLPPLVGVIGCLMVKWFASPEYQRWGALFVIILIVATMALVWWFEDKEPNRVA